MRAHARISVEEYNKLYCGISVLGYAVSQVTPGHNDFVFDTSCVRNMQGSHWYDKSRMVELHGNILVIRHPSRYMMHLCIYIPVA